MNNFELLKKANKNIFINKGRSILTILSIVVGSMSLTLAIGVGAGVTSFFEDEFNNVTIDNSIEVFSPYIADDTSRYESKNGVPLYSNEEPTLQMTSRGFKNIDIGTINSISKLKGVLEVIPMYKSNIEYVIFEDTNDRYVPVVDYYYTNEHYALLEGKFPQNKNEVIVSEEFLKLYNSKDIIGKHLDLYFYDSNNTIQQSNSFIVTGVKPTGRDDRPSIIINSTYNKEIHEVQFKNIEEDYLSTNNVRVIFDDDTNPEEIRKVKDFIENLGLSIYDISEVSGTAKEVGIYLTVGLIGFSFIVISASVFGIINTISMSIYERTREIGILRALGMSRWKIFKLFSYEGSIIGFWGGITGIILGYLAGLIANPIIASYFENEGLDSTLQLKFPLIWIIIALTSLIIIGFLSAVFPARKASRLDPIKALRYE